MAFGLTACDPPMPDDIRVALSEQTVICEPGLAELQLPESIADLGSTWSDAMSLACTDMQLSVVDAMTEKTGLVISPIGSTSEQSFLKLPFALDAAVLVVNLPEVYEISLSASTIQSIFSGEVTSWNDPLILADNDGIELPDQKIILPKEAFQAAKQSFSSWIETLTGSPLDLSKVADAKVSETELAVPEQPGAISIASYSSALLNGSVFAGILTEPGNLESVILASTESIFSASTQLVSEVTGDNISLTLDPSIEPKAPEGSFEAASPYQAIFEVELYFVGEESTLVRAAGRYLMRQESVGIISSSTMLPMPESVRILAVKIIEKGLTVPAAE
jgi:phosphate transport system substrate-binding protein